MSGVNVISFHSADPLARTHPRPDTATQISQQTLHRTRCGHLRLFSNDRRLDPCDVHIQQLCSQSHMQVNRQHNVLHQEVDTQKAAGRPPSAPLPSSRSMLQHVPIHRTVFALHLCGYPGCPSFLGVIVILRSTNVDVLLRLGQLSNRSPSSPLTCSFSSPLSSELSFRVHSFASLSIFFFFRFFSTKSISHLTVSFRFCFHFLLILFVRLWVLSYHFSRVDLHELTRQCPDLIVRQLVLELELHYSLSQGIISSLSLFQSSSRCSR